MKSIKALFKDIKEGYECALHAKHYQRLADKCSYDNKFMYEFYSDHCIDYFDEACRKMGSFIPNAICGFRFKKHR